MSLFGDLPPPTAHLRPRKENLEDEYKPQGASESEPDAKRDVEDSEDHDGEDRPDKRQRTEPQNSSGLSTDQIAAALTKIGSHISNPDKFSKAAGLLRQLLDSGALTKSHRDQLFEVVKAAFADFDNASEASLRRDYMKLCHSLDKQAEGLFSRAQRAQLEVYHIVGFTQNEMHTDDSFVFNKVLGRVKEAVAALPPASEEDEEALEELQAAAAASSSSSDDGDEGADGEQPRRDRLQGGGTRPSGGGPASASDEAATAPSPPPQPGLPSEPAGEAAALGAAAAEDGAADDDAEADPFGLDQLLPAPKRPRPAPPPPPATHPPPSAAQQQENRQPPSGKKEEGAAARRRARRRSAVWTAAQAVVMRRQALIECLITARGFHKTPWARTSVELLVEQFAKHRDRFAAEQTVAVDEMVRFVRAARQARPTGPSQKEINRDTTSFERARSEWSKVHVSARGKVGASGDAKTQNWLG